MESKLSKLPGLERSATNSYLGTHVSKGFYSIIERKGKMKETVEKSFKSIKTAAQNMKNVSLEVTAK